MSLSSLLFGSMFLSFISDDVEVDVVVNVLVLATCFSLAVVGVGQDFFPSNMDDTV